MNFVNALFLNECSGTNVRLNLKYLGWPYRTYIKTAKSGSFCEELVSENDSEAVLVSFCCYDHGGNASEAVQKIASDQKEYRKCSSFGCVCLFPFTVKASPD